MNKIKILELKKFQGELEGFCQELLEEYSYHKGMLENIVFASPK